MLPPPTSALSLSLSLSLSSARVAKRSRGGRASLRHVALFLPCSVLPLPLPGRALGRLCVRKLGQLTSGALHRPGRRSKIVKGKSYRRFVHEVCCDRHFQRELQFRRNVHEKLGMFEVRLGWGGGQKRKQTTEEQLERGRAIDRHDSIGVDGSLIERLPIDEKDEKGVAGLPPFGSPPLLGPRPAAGS